MNSTLKQPSAWIPIALTVAILGMMSLYLFGVLPPEASGDEGTMAHIFQLWAVLEFCTIAFFAFKQLGNEPSKAWKIIVLQIVFAVIPFAIVILNRW
jgi:hypothetical protein